MCLAKLRPSSVLILYLDYQASLTTSRLYIHSYSLGVSNKFQETIGATVASCK